MTRRSRRWTAAGAGAVALLAAVPSAALAGPKESRTEPIDFSYNILCEYGTPETADDLVLDGRIVGSVDITLHRRGQSVVPYVTSRGRATEKTHASPIGQDWRAEHRWQEKDQRLLSLEGTEATMLVGQNYHLDVYSPDGRRFASNNSRVEFKAVFDYVSDTLISFELTKAVGHFGAGSACDVIASYTG